MLVEVQESLDIHKNKKIVVEKSICSRLATNIQMATDQCIVYFNWNKAFLIQEIDCVYLNKFILMIFSLKVGEVVF